MEIKPPRLHESQRIVRDDPARFKVLACGRRWGKTRLGSALCIATAINGGRAWWVAPSYKMAAVGWRMVSRLGNQIPTATIRQVDRQVILPGGGSVQVRSADDPNSLRGEGLDFAVMDECAYMAEAAWVEALRPALSDRLGKALFISTPKGRNWFWRLFVRGQDDLQNEIRSWAFPTSDNPFVAKTEIEAARKSLPDRIFRQEYLAEFMEDAGGVFRRVAEAATATWQDEPIPGHSYAIGVDWARTNDATVFAVLDITDRCICYVDRMTNTDYNLQRTRLKALNERFGAAEIVAEYNSMGGPQVEALQQDGLPVRSFTTTNQSKQTIIDALALAFEQGSIRIVPDNTLVAELQAFEMTRTPSGALRYAAPDGMHDDTVMATALAWDHIGGGRWWMS